MDMINRFFDIEKVLKICDQYDSIKEELQL